MCADLMPRLVLPVPLCLMCPRLPARAAVFFSDDKGEKPDLMKAFEETNTPLADKVKICSTKKIPYNILEVCALKI